MSFPTYISSLHLARRPRQHSRRPRQPFDVLPHPNRPFVIMPKSTKITKPSGPAAPSTATASPSAPAPTAAPKSKTSKMSTSTANPKTDTMDASSQSVDGDQAKKKVRRWENDGGIDDDGNRVKSSYEVLRDILTSTKTMDGREYGWIDLWKGAAGKGIRKSSLANEKSFGSWPSMATSAKRPLYSRRSRTS